MTSVANTICNGEDKTITGWPRPKLEQGSWGARFQAAGSAERWTTTNWVLTTTDGGEAVTGLQSSGLTSRFSGAMHVEDRGRQGAEKEEQAAEEQARRCCEMARNWGPGVRGEGRKGPRTGHRLRMFVQSSVQKL